MKQKEELQEKYNLLVKEHENLQDKLTDLMKMSYIMFELDWSYTHANIQALTYKNNKTILSKGEYGNWSNRDSYATLFKNITTYIKEKGFVNRIIKDNTDDIYLIHFINDYL